jgi:hypothetical protein
MSITLVPICDFMAGYRMKFIFTFTTYVIRCDWGDPDVDLRIILKWIFRKWEGVVGTGWSGLRIGTGGGHL